MREIEIKARVIDEKSLLTALENAGVTLSASLKQRDIVYAEPGAIAGQPGYNFVRVRIENDEKAILTLKQTIKNLDKLELETEISDAEQMLKMLQTMRYELFNDLTKTRRKAKLGDIEICVDDVENLGLFIEAEKICDDDINSEEVYTELWQLFDSLGITKQHEATKGYDILMREKLAAS